MKTIQSGDIVQKGLNQGAANDLFTAAVPGGIDLASVRLVLLLLDLQTLRLVTRWVP